MKIVKRVILPIFLTTIWISFSEFFRNELLLKTFWLKHYQGLGIDFPSSPVNGIIWGIWSLLFAIAIFILAKKFTIIQTVFFSWFMGFVMMWVVIGNLNVLPDGSFLLYVIPLSILESFIATWIIKKFI